VTTYYVDVTTGNDGDDGLTEGDAWQTLGFAASQVAAGDLVYVKASASYVVQDGATGAILTIDTAGTAALPIVWEGYTSTPGDDGTVTLDASVNTLTYGVLASVSGNLYNRFNNFRCTGASSIAFDFTTSRDSIILVNCRGDNSLVGVRADDVLICIDCQFDNNSSQGVVCDVLSAILFCSVFSNGSHGIQIDGSLVYGCLLYANTNENVSQGDNAVMYVLACTADGDNAATLGIDMSGASTLPVGAINNIIYDCVTGITGNASLGDTWKISRNNLFNSNTTDRTNWPSDASDVTGVPLFTDEAGRDYTLQAGSPAVNAGKNLLSDGADIGASQEQDAATTIISRPRRVM
jgi:hypothetical protein